MGYWPVNGPLDLGAAVGAVSLGVADRAASVGRPNRLADLSGAGLRSLVVAR
jgi:hypothetical protein